MADIAATPADLAGSVEVAGLGNIKGAAIADFVGMLAGQFIPGKAGDAISTAAAVASLALAPTPLGVVSLMLTLPGLFGSNKPSSISLGDHFDVRGDGNGNDEIVFYTSDKDFGYRISNGMESLPLDRVTYELTVQDVSLRLDEDDNVTALIEPNEDRDMETRYFLDASYEFTPIHPGIDTKTVASLPRFGFEGDGAGPDEIVGYEISQAQYQRLVEHLGQSGVLRGGNDKVELLREFIADTRTRGRPSGGVIEFRQTDVDEGIYYFADIDDGVFRPDRLAS